MIRDSAFVLPWKYTASSPWVYLVHLDSVFSSPESYLRAVSKASSKPSVAQGVAVAQAELEAGAELEAELRALGAAEEAEWRSAVKAVTEKAVAD